MNAKGSRHGPASIIVRWLYYYAGHSWVRHPLTDWMSMYIISCLPATHIVWWGHFRPTTTPPQYPRQCSAIHCPQTYYDPMHFVLFMPCQWTTTSMRCAHFRTTHNANDILSVGVHLYVYVHSNECVGVCVSPIHNQFAFY